MNSKVWHERRLPQMAKRIQDHRSPFQRDRARVLHSAAFRRLQSKTQVMGGGQSDFYRTRLTHSLEAAQIGSGITAQLRTKYQSLGKILLPAEDSLIETICLAHDIGHPPFGHGGEVALNYMMREHGGFEGNGQTLRIVAQLEPFSENCGMNLARRSLLGLLKYPQTLSHLHHCEIAIPPKNLRQLKADDWYPPKGIYDDDQAILDWILQPLSAADKALFQTVKRREAAHHKTEFKSFDCSIMELADDIAYGIHDMEDAIFTGGVSQNLFEAQVIAKLAPIEHTWLNEFTATLTQNLFSSHPYEQKEAIGGLVNFLITAVEIVDLNEQQDTCFEATLLRYNAKLPAVHQQVLDIFKEFVLTYVIKQTKIQRLEYRGQQIVMELFEAFSSDPERLLPDTTVKLWRQAHQQQKNPFRVIADYVSSMTDDHATRTYLSLFSPQR
ncbi:MAG: anti-phage deoxyguanosine triphosphatase [Thalassotalea sp.]